MSSHLEWLDNLEIKPFVTSSKASTVSPGLQSVPKSATHLPSQGAPWWKTTTSSVDSGISGEFSFFENAIVNPTAAAQATNSPLFENPYFAAEYSDDPIGALLMDDQLETVCGGLNTSTLLDTQVLSECIRNLGYQPDDCSSISGEKPLETTTAGVPGCKIPAWKDDYALRDISQPIFHHNSQSSSSNHTERHSLCNKCSKEMLLAKPHNHHHNHVIHQQQHTFQNNVPLIQKTIAVPQSLNSATVKSQSSAHFSTLSHHAVIESKHSSVKSPTQSIAAASTTTPAVPGATAGNKIYTYCTFCKNNGESEAIYGTHYLKDATGVVTCPILRAYTCPICGQNGDKAHTVKYCPVAARLAPKDAPVRSEMRVLRTARTSAGRRRFF